MSEFKSESSDIVNQMAAILEKCEEGASGPDSMENFGQLADRILGAARQLVRNHQGGHSDLTMAAEFTQLCKLLGYKCAQLDPAGALWPLAIAVLLDATVELKNLIGALTEAQGGPATAVERTLIDRLQWLSQQFDEAVEGNVPMSSGRIVDPTHLEDLFAKIKKSKT